MDGDEQLTDVVSQLAHLPAQLLESLARSPSTGKCPSTHTA
jgi:hypothetical protein